MMKNIFISGVLMMLVLFQMGCKGDCYDLVDTSSGVIEQDINFGSCFSDVGALESQYIINDEATYQSLGILPINSPDCEGSSLPEIDFNTYTLLGLYADGACDVSFDRIVEKDEAAMKYIYTISVTSCGNCESLRFGMNWVLVPKLPENYTVDFEVI